MSAILISGVVLNWIGSTGRLDAKPFWTFGVSNLVVAVLFWILLVGEAG